MGVRVSAGPTEPDPAIRLVCRSPEHKATVTLAVLRREDRWDGSGGHYWVRVAKMSDKERARWQESDLADREALPRDYRDAQPDNGFRWLRHGETVTVAEGYTIGQAFHHNARRLRTGEPEPGVLDGVTRVFELPRCHCGARGVRGASAEVVERVLDALHSAGQDAVDLPTFRTLVTTRRAGGR